jgi:hypothetical protein
LDPDESTVEHPGGGVLPSQSSPPRAPFAGVRGRQFQLIEAVFPAIALCSHLGQLGLEHHQHLFGDVGPHPCGDQFVYGRLWL